MKQVENFIRYITTIKHYSDHTVTSYKNDLEQFMAFCSLPEGQFPDHHHIREWIVDLMNNGITARSVNRKLSALKSFYHYLVRENILESNPVKKVILPKDGQKASGFCSREKHGYVA